LLRLRAALGGRPVAISSGYRCPAHNRGAKLRGRQNYGDTILNYLFNSFRRGPFGLLLRSRKVRPNVSSRLARKASPPSGRPVGGCSGDEFRQPPRCSQVNKFSMVSPEYITIPMRTIKA